MEYPVISLPENLWLGMYLPLSICFIFISEFYFRKKLERVLTRTRIKALSNRSAGKVWSRFILFVLGLTGIFLALLGPRWGYQEIIEEKKNIDVGILIDVSRSMLVEDIKPNRLERAKLKVNDLVDLVSSTGGYRISLTVFAGSSFVYCPLTEDYASLRSFIRNISHLMISEQGTDLTLGLKTALSAFPKDQGKEQKVVIVFTDGENHERDVIKTAEEARDQGIIIHTIGVGTPNGELVPIENEQGEIVSYLKDDQEKIIISKLDQETLLEIANLTGGSYFNSSLDQNDFRIIIQELEQLNQKSKQKEVIRSKKEQFQWLVLIAWVMIFSETLINTKKNKFNLVNIFRRKS